MTRTSARCTCWLIKITRWPRSGSPATAHQTPGPSAYARDHGIRWHVYWSARTRDVAAAEASAHRDLQGQRFALVPDAREIFHLTPEKARQVCERYVRAPDSNAPPELRIGRPAWRRSSSASLPPCC